VLRSIAPARPRRATRRLPWRQAAYASLDFETTGLDYARDEIVSFGVVPVDSGRAILATSVHQLVRSTIPPTPRSQTVHELRPQDLASSPPLDEARSVLAEALRDRYVLAWFAEVEVEFLARAFGTSRRRWATRTIDVRDLAIAVDGQPRQRRAELGYGLTAVAHRHGVPVADPHVAYDDALVTAQLFLVLVRKLPGLASPSVRDLLKLGRP
jgi:DNA polymerase-3 subunit epsilon